jgi:hypothetical protein
MEIVVKRLSGSGCSGVNDWDLYLEVVDGEVHINLTISISGEDAERITRATSAARLARERMGGDGATCSCMTPVPDYGEGLQI